MSGPMGAEGSTIGRDLRQAPRGREIPATGLGVDLVDSRPRIDEAVEATSAAGRRRPREEKPHNY